jgi:hypothetical protein
MVNLDVDPQKVINLQVHCRKANFNMRAFSYQGWISNNHREVAPRIQLIHNLDERHINLLSRPRFAAIQLVYPPLIAKRFGFFTQSLLLLYCQTGSVVKYATHFLAPISCANPRIPLPLHLSSALRIQYGLLHNSAIPSLRMVDALTNPQDP